MPNGNRHAHSPREKERVPFSAVRLPFCIKGHNSATWETILTEMKVRMWEIRESPLLTVKKIDAVKIFVLPILDFMMLNGDVRRKQLKKMNQKIRQSINAALQVRGLPVECHHAHGEMEGCHIRTCLIDGRY
jgi:hypothetical protein